MWGRMDGESLLRRYITLSGLSGRRIWETGGRPRAAAVKLIPQPAHRMDKRRSRSVFGQSVGGYIYSVVSRLTRQEGTGRQPRSTIHDPPNSECGLAPSPALGDLLAIPRTGPERSEAGCERKLGHFSRGERQFTELLPSPSKATLQCIVRATDADEIVKKVELLSIIENCR